MNNKVLILLIIIVAIIVIAAIGSTIGILSQKNGKNETESTYTTSMKTNTINNISNNNIIKEEKNMDSNANHHVTIVIKDYGTIKLELYPDKAPITVANFEKLVNEGFYNGLTFHRIMNGFMIQGGDPEGTGFGGSSETIKGEFKANGVDNNISHIRGVISMARSNNFNSASSQFFIVQKNSTFLDGQYAGFGRVTEGIEIVDKICKDTPVVDDNGTVLKNNQPIIEKITMED